jgi:glycosyltransferase involved in cell wall biosynthesis
VDRLIRACRRIDAQLVLVGDGPQRHALQAQARLSGVCARFVGAQGRTHTWQWLRVADVLVLPSIVLPDGRTDSAPLSLLEGLAAGLPVIASRVGGNADLVQHEVNGLLVPPGNVSALRGAISRLVESPAMRRDLAVAARMRARQFEWNQIGAQLRALLDRL